ncbi:MAG TPA: phosphodiester glycosidase family protein [Myxococcales bacterium]|nr:phosphodiester glycosidase family protein [Myxococcales bacterium]
MTKALLLLAALSVSAPWKRVAPGVEAAPAAELGADPAWAARVVLVDPRSARFLVRYDASRPTLAEWRKRFPSALAIVNGSFYSKDGSDVRPTCELVSEGKRVRGAGCQRQDALFFAAAAQPASPGASSPPLSREPRVPRFLSPAEFRAEEWAEAMKSFPALVRGGAAACGGPNYCAELSRTAALAQLKDGRILLFASQWPAVRREVGRWLAEQLGATDALNLDGGPEATLALKDEPPEDSIGGPGVGLPIVLIVMAR